MSRTIAAYMRQRGAIPSNSGTRGSRCEPMGHRYPGPTRAECPVCRKVYVLRDGALPSHGPTINEYCPGGPS